MSNYCSSDKLAKLARGAHELLIMAWDRDWCEYAALARPESKLTYANIRGAVRKNLREAGYKVDILEPELRQVGLTQYGVTFRFSPHPDGKLTAAPSRAPSPPAVAPPLPEPDYIPSAETRQLQLILPW